MNKEEFYKQLVQRYLNNEATEEELEALFHLMETGEIDNVLKAALDEEAILAAEMPEPKRNKWWLRIAVAASVIAAFSAGGYLLLHKPIRQNTIAKIKDIPPGHNQATLTLANGKRIILTKGLTGQLATQNNANINVDSALAYTATGQHITEYNTMSTAKGEQSPYPLILADGTKVWLNAESSITFPTAFSGERTVKITGEAYFEVKHDNIHPFKVQTNSQIIEDIGTKFDVNAYTDEPNATTTLIEGAVTVNGRLLKPGQALKGQQIKDASISETIAWVNGKFRYNDEHIQTIMRQLSRWYDIEVSYQGTMPQEGLNGQISRYKNISQVLQMLEATKTVHFKVEGRRVTVMQ